MRPCRTALYAIKYSFAAFGGVLFKKSTGLEVP